MKIKLTFIERMMDFCRGTSGEVTKSSISVGSAAVAATATTGIVTLGTISLPVVGGIGLGAAVINAIIGVVGSKAQSDVITNTAFQKEFSIVHEKLNDLLVLFRFLKDLIIFGIMYFAAKELVILLKNTSSGIAFLLGIIVTILLIWFFTIAFKSSDKGESEVTEFLRSGN